MVKQVGSQEVKVNLWGLIETIAVISIPLLASWGGWTLKGMSERTAENSKEIQSVGTRVTTIEANRYTQADAKRDRDVSQEQMAQHLSDDAKYRQDQVAATARFQQDVIRELSDVKATLRVFAESDTRRGQAGGVQ